MLRLVQRLPTGFGWISTSFAVRAGIEQTLTGPAVA